MGATGRTARTAPAPVTLGLPTPPRRPRWWWAIAALAVLAGLWWLAGDGGNGLPDALSANEAAEVDEAVAGAIDAALDDLAAAPPDAVAVYEALLPSIVAVRAGSATSSDGLGAGVVVSDDGTILTALHVVAGAATIRVAFADGTEATAAIVEQDAAHDVAVLAPDGLPEVVVPAVLGGGVRVGDDVYAIGHPLGLTASLTAGVVSGVGRTVPVPGGGELEGLIQFDAAVNPGSSGGPLVNRAGQVVGIVTSLANPSQQGFFVGIGFAVPIATAGGAAGAPAQ